MTSAVTRLRAAPWILLAATVHAGLILLLALVTFPLQQLKQRSDQYAPAFLLSAGCQFLLILCLALWVVAESVPVPPEPMLEVRVPDQLDAPTLTYFDDSMLSPSLNEADVVGAMLGGDAMSVVEVEHPDLFVPEVGTGRDLFNLGKGELTKKIGANEQAGVGVGASFYGITAGGNTFVFVVDISGSMQGTRFRRVKAELEQTIARLNENQAYYIIFFNQNSYPMPSETMVPATLENIAKTKRWIGKVRCIGDTDPEPSLKLALRLKPDAVFLLSDGEFDRFVAVRIPEYQTAVVIPVHTVGFTNRDGEAVLKAIAERTGGTYRYVQ